MAEDDNDQQADARLRRALRARQAAGTQRTKKQRADWAGESAAIYCRISHVNDDDQTGVERQESICREVADRLGLVVDEEQVFVDNNRAAWQRKRKRPGWDALLAEIEEAIGMGTTALEADRKSLPSLLLVADELDKELRARYPREAATRDFHERVTTIKRGAARPELPF
jgi:site-specific DNA recombinase